MNWPAIIATPTITMKDSFFASGFRQKKRKKKKPKRERSDDSSPPHRVVAATSSPPSSTTSTGLRRQSTKRRRVAEPRSTESSARPARRPVHFSDSTTRCAYAIHVPARAAPRRDRDQHCVHAALCRCAHRVCDAGAGTARRPSVRAMEQRFVWERQRAGRAVRGGEVAPHTAMPGPSDHSLPAALGVDGAADVRPSNHCHLPVQISARDAVLVDAEGPGKRGGHDGR